MFIGSQSLTSFLVEDVRGCVTVIHISPYHVIHLSASPSAMSHVHSETNSRVQVLLRGYISERSGAYTCTVKTMRTFIYAGNKVTSRVK